jgi:hypothetical protein
VDYGDSIGLHNIRESPGGCHGGTGEGMSPQGLTDQGNRPRDGAGWAQQR